MKAKTLFAIASASVFGWAATGAWATSGGPDQHPESGGAQAAEEVPIRNTLDMVNGGFKGWGPMPNPISAASGYEPATQRAEDDMRNRLRHLAEVGQARERVWIANAPLRAEYENIGATRGSAGGLGRFFSGDR